MATIYQTAYLLIFLQKSSLFNNTWCLLDGTLINWLPFLSYYQSIWRAYRQSNKFAQESERALHWSARHR